MMWGRGWRRGFGRGYGRGFGRRFWRFNENFQPSNLDDPDRWMFGFGPCGEAAYREYKKRKNESSSP